MAAASEEPIISLEYTPTWVVASVCAVMVTISLCAERFLHYLGKFLKHNDQKALFNALQKLKEELMLLGFISLLLTVFQSIIKRICISESLSSHMLPCKREEGFSQHMIHYGKDFSLGLVLNRRLLSEGDKSGHCNQGKVPLLSAEALHQLHFFIFVLAVVYVVFSATTMVLGGYKVRKWKHWEDTIRKENLKPEKQTKEHKYHHMLFLNRSMGFWRKTAIMSFFKQFHASVTKSDYIALRWGFIMRHCSSNPDFDFHKFLMRTLESDFKKVIGIGWYLWLFVVIFLLLNINGWHTYFWLSFLPLILLLVVGTKLEHIITSLAEDAAALLTDDQDVRVVKPSDEHFWFHRPSIVHYLITFILFQNSFGIAFIFWISTTYGFHSCIMEKAGYVIPRLIIGVIVQVLCSYITLPLYILVTQMGDSFKHTIFDEQLQLTLHGWAESAKNRRKHKRSDAVWPPFLKAFIHKNKKNEVSGSEIQIQTLPASGEFQSVHDAQHPVALEGIIASVSGSRRTLQT